MFDNRQLRLDLCAVGLLALVVFLSVSLCTYHPADTVRTWSLPSIRCTGVMSWYIRNRDK
jgi:hypothetical protein